MFIDKHHLLGHLTEQIMITRLSERTWILLHPESYCSEYISRDPLCSYVSKCQTYKCLARIIEVCIQHKSDPDLLSLSLCVPRSRMTSLSSSSEEFNALRLWGLGIIYVMLALWMSLTVIDGWI